jgi:hypothetical protein
MKIVFFLFLFSISIAIGQDVRDLVRFSQTQVHGSARFEAMGGSFGALGADLSTSAINPAGFGRFSKSTFGMSMQNTSINNSALFNNELVDKKNNNLRLNNLGVVICNDVSEKNNGFLFNQIGFTYNRIENFRNDIAYKGTQYYSLLDEFTSNAYGLTPDEVYDYLPFSSALAWDTYAIDKGEDGNYVSRLDSDTDIRHRRNINYSGGMSEYNINISGNYINKLYIGGNIGFRTVKYTEDTYHYEQPIFSDAVTLDSFQYEYHLYTKGTGANIKLGFIYLPIESFRIGLSLHTPTFFKLKDTYSADMTSFHKDGVYEVEKEFKPKGEYKYKMRTPTKAILSLAYLFRTAGSINVDLDVVNYKWAHFRSTDDPMYEPYDFSFENSNAKSLTRTVLNIRVGGELFLMSHLFLRAGYAFYPSAYNSNVNLAKNQHIYSGGFGYKWGKHGIDLAVKYHKGNFSYFAFSESQTDITQNRIGVTVNYSVSF